MDYFKEADADIFCVQETKLQEGQIDIDAPGYHAYWNYADKKGYSGVALFTKREPLTVIYGFGADEHNHEGRVITAEFEDYYFITCYTPNSQNELKRLDYRVRWEEDFREYLIELDKKKPVILCGDLNVAHEEIDLKNPKTNRKNAGFTDEEREQMTLLLGSGYFIPGFEEQVAGAAVGEERDVKVTFPTEYVPELAGKDAVFHIKVHQITRRAMPEWDDDFARRQGFADVSALRRAVMETAVQKKQAQAAEQFANDLIRQVTEAMTVTIPAAMVENQLDGLIAALRGHLQAQGVSLEQYLEMGNTTMEQLRDHAREQAAAAARYELAMTEIARREGIDITEADVDAKYAELSKQYGLSVELLRQQLPPLRLRHDLKLAAAQAVVVDSAKRK